MISSAAAVQRRLWDTDPEGWARFAEGHNRPLFKAVLDAAGVEQGTRVLDIGCGAGLTLVLAAERGATVSGVDISPGLLGVARRRLPDADLREADMEDLPYRAASFDAVLGVNAFQFAGDPEQALREAARVCRPGGTIVASLFATPERSRGSAIHTAMAALAPAGRERDRVPAALSRPGALEAALRAAGLEPVADGEVACSWRYTSIDDAVRALLSSAVGARARESTGEAAVRSRLTTALGPFQDPATGAVTLDNMFRWIAASRPSRSL